jgi:hypothetical protein
MFNFVECHCTEFCYAKSHNTFVTVVSVIILSVLTPSAIVQCFVMLGVIILSAILSCLILLNVIVLSFVMLKVIILLLQ